MSSMLSSFALASSLSLLSLVLAHFTSSSTFSCIASIVFAIASFIRDFISTIVFFFVFSSQPPENPKNLFMAEKIPDFLTL